MDGSPEEHSLYTPEEIAAVNRSGIDLNHVTDQSQTVLDLLEKARVVGRMSPDFELLVSALAKLSFWEPFADEANINVGNLPGSPSSESNTQIIG